MSVAEYSEYDKLKEELMGLGLHEDGMNVDDMMDLMAAIRNSQDSALKEERLRESNKKVQASISAESVPREARRGMERRYKNVPERRMPWNLFPYPEQLSLEQKSRVLAAYKEQLTLCQYRKAKSSTVFAEWNCVLKLPFKSEYKPPSIHHTRSGRTIRAAPLYVDDDSDTELTSVSRKPRKKMKKLTNDEIIAKSSLFKDVPSVNSNVINASNESSRSGEGRLGAGEGSTAVVAPVFCDTPPDHRNEAVALEGNKGVSRKRARLEKDSSID